jgi:hypothetical protein
MALDLNATPDDEGDEGPDLNQQPANEQDRSIHDPLEAVDAGEIKRGDLYLPSSFNLQFSTMTVVPFLSLLCLLK